MTRFVCTHSQDGMDQAKWSIPRCRSLITPKSLAGHQRLKFKVQGVWCHGICLKLWVLDPRVPADSSTIVETLTRNIENVMKLCEQKGVRPPDQLLCWVPCLRIAIQNCQQSMLTSTCTSGCFSATVLGGQLSPRK